ncbi:Nodulation efficiency, NfeD [methanotrophic bacterial endosymbiont of Bathymodiolus sp.]|jgi:membrane protein implicated in regulation of membrane protease activity|nr:Nodulation efficiency, NfeD [methanotrophic bacterial endosymbiont of Bathymodiolus sp.]
MFEWLNANIAYWHWLIFGLCLALAEIMLLSFVTLWFGLAAIVVGVLLLIYPFSFTLQLLIWVVLSMIIVFSWFKWVSPHLKNKTFSEMSREGMIGQVGSVIEYNSVHEGRGTLRFPAPILGNDEWQFICTDTVDVGDRVIVREFSGNALIVSAK